MLQAGPKTSAFVVTPVLSALDAVAGAAADAGAAAGALVGALLELVPVLPQAARATVIVAIAPSAARRWNLCTVFPLEQNPVDPGVSSELSKSRGQRFDTFLGGHRVSVFHRKRRSIYPRDHPRSGELPPGNNC
jgi:hypothetical protein